MDVRGGGAAADEARIVKPGYESDDEGDEPKRWAGYHTASAPGGHMVSPSASASHSTCKMRSAFKDRGARVARRAQALGKALHSLTSTAHTHD